MRDHYFEVEFTPNATGGPGEFVAITADGKTFRFASLDEARRAVRAQLDTKGLVEGFRVRIVEVTDGRRTIIE